MGLGKIIANLWRQINDMGKKQGTSKSICRSKKNEPKAHF